MRGLVAHLDATSGDKPLSATRLQHAIDTLQQEAAHTVMLDPVPHYSSSNEDLLLRETNHRCSNDLQLVVSLLAIQSRRAASVETRQALNDAMERVMVLARARSTLHDARQPTLETALRQVCEALHAQAEPRSIIVSLKTAHDVKGLSAKQVTTLALVANELATNAIKHAYRDDTPGHIRVAVDEFSGNIVRVTVDDDGLPFPELAQPGDRGMGLGLAKRLMASIGGLLLVPEHGSKIFELRVPLTAS